jgi:signal transduction histidine kinase
MSKRPAFWLAWFTWVLYLVIAIVTLLFKMKNAPSELFSAIFNALVLLAFATVGTLIASRRPQNPIGWIFCISTLLWALGVFMLEYAVYALITVPGSLPAGALIGAFGGWARGMGWFLMLTFLLLLFPNGHLLSSRWRPLARLIVGLLAAFTITSLLAPYLSDTRLATVHNPIGILGAADLFNMLTGLIPLLLLATIIPCIVAVVLRFRRARGVERQQLKWFAYGMAISILMLIVIVILVYTTVSGGSDVLFFLAVVCIPISAGIAILRYRLYDIDVLINRTLVYGLLTFLVVGIYVLAVGYLGALFRTGSTLLISLIATGLVAVLFQPLRALLQRSVNRLLYGQRDEPYAVITRLSQRLEATLAPDAVLPTIVETIAQSFKLPYAAILLKNDDEFAIAASYGDQEGEPLALPLVYQRAPIGKLLLAPRAPGEAFTPVDLRLLNELTHQIGLAAHAVRLTADLQLSNEHLRAAQARLVTAREEERRRLRRDLHDGLGPALAALTLKIGAARKLLFRDPATVESLLLELNSDIETTVGDIRRLVYNLRPPALDELGLIGAIRERVANYMISSEADQANGLQIKVEAPEHLPLLPAAVEVAAYRIVQEALTNVVRHAHAHTCNIRLSLTSLHPSRAKPGELAALDGWISNDDMLTIEICDDGAGIAAGQPAGVGIRSMHERATELGGTCTVEPGASGGTRVLARLPITKE